MSLGSLVGIVQIIGAVGYFALSMSQVIRAARSDQLSDVVVRVLQVLFGPLLLLMAGLILLFQGWRLDPILALQNALITLLVAYLMVVDLRR